MVLTVQDAFLGLLELYGEIVSFDMDEPMRRMRIVYSIREEAVNALGNLHGKLLDGVSIRVHYAPPENMNCPDTFHLAVPLPSRQFLISPPPSPPVGWEPCPEDAPVVRSCSLLLRCVLWSCPLARCATHVCS